MQVQSQLSKSRGASGKKNQAVLRYTTGNGRGEMDDKLIC